MFWFNLFEKGCVLVQPFSKRLCFGPTFFEKVVFWSKLLRLNLFLKGCVLVQSATLEPFSKSVLVFATLFSKSV